MVAKRAVAVALVGLSVAFLAGCDPNGRLSPGDRVILAGPTDGPVRVVEMDPHVSQTTNPGARVMADLKGPVTSESLDAGTRAVVITDDREGEHLRLVMVRVSDGPYRDMTGKVERESLRTE